MEQNSFQDIIPPKKSIRDIPLPKSRISKKPESPLFLKKDTTTPIINPFKNFLWVGAGVALLIAIYFVTTFFAHVNVKMTINNEEIPVDIKTNATKDGASSTLQYSIITAEQNDTIELEATGNAKKVDTKASGTIIIYNTTDSPQDLVATTRFQTADNLVYRIDKKVTVPVGSIEAVVFADQPGDSYNKGKSDFTIPGFQGSAKFQKIYAKSKTDLSGGFSGTIKDVAPDELEKKKTALEGKNKDSIRGDIASKVAEGSVLFYEGLVYQTNWTVSTENNKSILKGNTKAIGPVFLRSAIADVVQKGLGDKNIKSVSNFDKLVVNFDNNESLISGNFPDIGLKISGSVSSFQDITLNDLKNKLAGIPKKDLQSVILEYPSITRIDASFVPPWQSHFPKDTKKINISLTNNQ